ncbi:MAG: hypothetical protein R6U46_00765 [Marinilabilia sp.]
MERKTPLNKLISLIIFILISVPAMSQERDSIFYECYITGDMETWKQTMEEMENEFRHSERYEELFELTLAWYGYIGYCIGNKLEDEAEKYLESGKDHLERLLNHPGAGAAAHAMKSGFYGFEMALTKFKAVVLGRRSVSALKKAASIDRENVHYLVEKGNQMYYMPSLLGGDKEVALSHYKQAVKAIESGKAYHREHWFYLNTLVVLANTYQEAGNIPKARNTYLKIMDLAPRFEWVREELWPDFTKEFGPQ